MLDRPFEGLEVSPEEGASLLTQCVEALVRIVAQQQPWPPALTRPGPPSALMALAGLCYFVVERDVVPDSAPGGLADDLAVMTAILTRIEPEAAKGLAAAAPAPGTFAPEALSRRFPGLESKAFAPVYERLLRTARVSDPWQAVTKAREKLAAIRRELGLPAPPSAASTVVGALGLAGQRMGPAMTAYLALTLGAWMAQMGRGGRAARVKRPAPPPPPKPKGPASTMLAELDRLRQVLEGRSVEEIFGPLQQPGEIDES